MKELKKNKKINISNTICNYSLKITFKDVLRVMGIRFLIIFTLATTILMGMSIPVLTKSNIIKKLIDSLNIAGGFAFLDNGATLATILMEHIQKLEAEKEIKNVVDIFKKYELEISTKDLEEAIVYEMENSKGKEVLENGKYKKRKRVINYVAINNKDKYKIIKEVTIYVRNVFYKKYSSNAYIMNEQDLVTEGFIDEKGKVTEKGKLLNLKMN